MAKATVKESWHRFCCFSHAGERKSVYQLERLHCCNWCKELSNQADILPDATLSEKKKEHSIVNGWWSVGCHWFVNKSPFIPIIPSVSFPPVFAHEYDEYLHCTQQKELLFVWQWITQLSQWPCALRRWWWLQVYQSQVLTSSALLMHHNETPKS